WGNRPTNSRILPIQETPIPKADKALACGQPISENAGTTRVMPFCLALLALPEFDNFMHCY
ncbi:hypothetical protein, partial [Rosistilla oblonga]|uniref:hypothetical protein n=1 Tax=Rosistilla oblonga TaxID=2527990 RepID=UPI003A978E00